MHMYNFAICSFPIARADGLFRGVFIFEIELIAKIEIDCVNCLSSVRDMYTLTSTPKPMVFPTVKQL